MTKMKTITQILNEISKRDIAHYDHPIVVRFIKRKRNLITAYLAYKKIFPKSVCARKASRAIFNSYILDDPSLEREYKDFHNVEIN